MAVQNNLNPPKYVLYYRHDIREGLKFDNDRHFKNKLILKVILLMTALVLVATCSFIAWSEFKPEMTGSAKQVISTKIYREDLSSLDYDDEVLKDERAVGPEVRTQYVPAFADPSSNHIRDTREVKNRDTSKKVENRVRRVPNAERGNFWRSQETARSIRQWQVETMKSYMDTSISPCDDFYQYACGKWTEKNEIPEDRAGYDTFEMLRDSLDIVLKHLMEEETPNESSDSAVNKAKTLYRSCMNEETLEKRGKEPLIELINELGGWPVLDADWNATSFDWLALVARLRLYYNDVLITHWIGQDFMASSNYIIQFDQATLGLSTRDHFLKQENKHYKDAYKTYIVKTALLLGADSVIAENDAQGIVDFETALANITTPQDERRNISQMYEKLTVSQLEVELVHVRWRSYLSTVLGWNVSADEPVVMFARKYFTHLHYLIQETPARTLANYIMWRFVKHRANNLNAKFQDVKQQFLLALSGREKLPPRWTFCVHHINGNMGMALGSLFVRRFFDENSKNDTLFMTHSIMGSFKEMLDTVTWIDEDTRRLAQEKVRAITLRIGYPDFIINEQQLNEYFANVTVSDTHYFENSLNVLRFVAQTEMNRLRTPADKTSWNMPPAIVNAYYSRNKNQILFPAGILQPPFYHKHFPRCLNYGGIGVVIGHEIIHGFDDKGRLYDLEGNLNKWWKEDAIQNFHRRAKCLIDQYNSYNVDEVDMRIDGVNTQGENIADNGGIKQAFKAYESWVNENNPTDDYLQGINATNFQLFFINFAQVWCGAMRPEAFRNKIQTSVHPPGKFRVIGTLSNSEEFARVFNCSLGSGMNPKEKCRVW